MIICDTALNARMYRINKVRVVEVMIEGNNNELMNAYGI